MTVIITKHFVEFLHPGMIMSDTSSKEISKRDDSEIKMGEHSFGYRFYDRNQFSNPMTGEILTGEPTNYSSWRYEGQAMDASQVEQNIPDNRILLSNMKYNGYKKIVKTKFGQCIPLEKGDIVLGEII